MAAPTKMILPAILLANDLRAGDVVFWTGTGWSLDPADAHVANSEAEALALDSAAKQSLANNEVVDAYRVDVTVDARGLPVPNHFRERFKIAGPSIRKDLGKQADFRRSVQV